jgi:hypothetical protein
MQKAFITIALALTLTSAFAYTAGWTVTNWVKGPISVVQDSETNFTNATYLSLNSLNIGELDLLAEKYATLNSSANTWNIWYKKLDTKSLSTSSNLTANFTAPSKTAVYFINGYAVYLTSDNDTNVPQLRVYQTPINGGAVLGRLTVSNNTDSSFIPKTVASGPVLIGKTYYVFYLAANNQVNVTSFVVGGAAVGSLKFSFSKTFDNSGSISVAWGESLGSSQLFANWVEAGVFKDGLIDLTKGSVTVTNVGGFNPNTGYICKPFATDKKWYGDLCYTTNSTAQTISYYVRSNTTSVIPLTNNFTNTSTLETIIPYGPYIALILSNTTVSGQVSYSYEIWNLDTYTLFKPRAQFLTILDDSNVQFYRVTSGGFYSLLWNNRINNQATLTSVSVGLVLGSSYLASIFGFLLTIIAGLVLF